MISHEHAETQAETAPSSNGQALSHPEGRTGPTYWRHLEESLGRQQIDELVHREFPSQAGELLDPVSRRNFVKLMGASLMLAGLSSCARQPLEKIVPYVSQPEHLVPGRPMHFATAMPYAGYGIGLVATSHEGRPTKLEGLPEHPSSLGSTCSHAEAAVLNLYDPDRLDTVLQASDISTWGRFAASLMERVAQLDGQGTGLYLLSETMTSPAFGWQIRQLRERYPNLRWHQWDPTSNNNARIASQASFGDFVDTVHDFRAAQVVLSLDANFLMEGPAQIRHQRDWAEARDADSNGGTMGRLYMLETSPTLTGANADHKVNMRYPEVELVARAIAARLGVQHADASEQTAVPASWIEAVAQDLQAAGPKSIVIAGSHQPPAVHMLAHAINHILGSTGENGAVRYINSPEVEPVDQMASMQQLVADMNAGMVKILVMLEGNPVYNTPANIDFAAALTQVPVRVHLSQHANETSNLCHWTVPAAHFLESWSDVRAHDGTISLVQPLILPMYQGRSAHELLAVLLGESTPDGHLILQQAWRAMRGEEGFDAFWRTALGSGIVADTASQVRDLVPGAVPAAQPMDPHQNLDILFRNDPSVLDGRFANNGWLQELPRPLTLLTWDNAVFMHPQTARRLEVEHEDLVEVEHAGRKVQAPVMIQFGHAQGAITVHLGYGRRQAGRVGTGVGFDAYSIQHSASPWFGTGVSLRKLGRKYPLAHTSEHWNIEQSIIDQGKKAEDRHLIREATFAYYQEHKDFAQHMGHHAPGPEYTLYKPDELPYNDGTGYAWGMTIDLNRCTGCNACVSACMAENNIPVVGKKEVARGREMQWIRVDRYYKGNFDGDVEVALQPIPCMQCENAPCEPVCPVAATVHSDEGLNDMVYNRCIGTRYCSNNCPYKVRRFNFFKYADHTTPQLKMMRNPNVTVRSRGVMEKCTYCVQRINLARIEAKRENRKIHDGEVRTACQAACPSRAIVFGDINDPEARVTQLKSNPRNYGLLADIGTRPRTTYLAQLRNPSPALHAGAGAHATETEH